MSAVLFDVRADGGSGVGGLAEDSGAEVVAEVVGVVGVVGEAPWRAVSLTRTAGTLV